MFDCAGHPLRLTETFELRFLQSEAPRQMCKRWLAAAFGPRVGGIAPRRIIAPG